MNDFLYWLAVISELREYLIRCYREALSTINSSETQVLTSWGRPSVQASRWTSGIKQTLHILKRKISWEAFEKGNTIIKNPSNQGHFLANATFFKMFWQSMGFQCRFLVSSLQCYTLFWAEPFHQLQILVNPLSSKFLPKS